MVMEKSWNMKNWPKVIEFCDQLWNFTNFAPKFYQFCFVLVTAKKLSRNLEIPHFRRFPQNVANAKSGREMVMENQEMVMEKSWENVLSSMWEPWSRMGRGGGEREMSGIEINVSLL